MQRLLGLLGLTCLVVLTACFYTSSTAAMVFGIVCCVLLAVSLIVPKIRKDKTLPVIFVTALLAVSVFLFYTYQFVVPLTEAYNEKKVKVTATQLSDETYANGYYTYKLKVTSVNGQKEKFKMMLRSKQPFATEPYDELTFKCELRTDKNASDASKGVFLHTYLFDEVDCDINEPDSRPFAYHIIKFRLQLSTNLYLDMDYDTASFANAVFLGDRNSISYDVKGLLRSTGLSHIAVVSGLHLSIITMICRKIFKKIFGNRVISGCSTIAFIWLFAGLTGFGVSIIRSAVMLTIFTVGNMIGRRADSLNSIGAAALLLLILNPYAVGDVGMLLSFAATLGIVLWSKGLFNFVMFKLCETVLFKRKIIYLIIKMIIETVSCSLCATLWTLPITILVFKGFSLVSVVANLLVVPFMTVILLCIGGCVVIHYVNFISVLGDALSLIVSLFYNYMVWICTILGNLPFAYIYTTQTYWYVWIIFTIAFVIVASVVRKRFVTMLCVLLSLLMILSCTVVHRLVTKDVLLLHITDTGRGQSVVLESSQGYAVLCATGTSSKNYLLHKKVETMDVWGNDVLIDTGGYNSREYCENLLNEFDYEQILRYHNSRDLYAESYSEDEHTFSAHHIVKLWDKAQVELIPTGNFVYEYLQAGDTTVLILPRGADCEQIPDVYRNADYLISDGYLKSSDLLRFNTLVVSDDEDFADDSVLNLYKKADSIKSGSDVVLKINID